MVEERVMPAPVQIQRPLVMAFMADRWFKTLLFVAFCVTVGWALNGIAVGAAAGTGLSFLALVAQDQEAS